MKQDILHSLLESIAQGTLSVDKALKHKVLQEHFAHFTQNDPTNTTPSKEKGTIVDTLCGLTLDTSREARTGLGEVVFAPHKSPAQLLSAIQHLHNHAPVLVTRVQSGQWKSLQEHFPQGSSYEEAKLFSLGKNLPTPPTEENPWKTHGDVIVISAGGADRPVALEAFATLHFWGIHAGFIADVGVAGLHRLTPHVPALQKAKIIIAVAGMEGALPGIVAGFVHCPVLAVPTSVGYGVGAHGKAALSSMLCSCVPGIAVCNIDNGFGAAAFAAKSMGILQNRDLC